MEKNKNISPSIEDGKQRIELYNKMSHAMRDLTRDEKCIVMRVLNDYVRLLDCTQYIDKKLSLVYGQCTTFVFDYLYKSGQLKADNVGFDPEIRKHIEDVFITLATD